MLPRPGCRQHRARRRHPLHLGERRDDRGFAIIWALGLTVAMIGMVGLVVDGGNVLRARSDAHSAASAAARVGAQKLDVDSMLASGGGVAGGASIDPVEGPAAAEEYLIDRGFAPGDITVTLVSGGEAIMVHVDDQVELQILWRDGRALEVGMAATARAAEN